MDEGKRPDPEEEKRITPIGDTMKISHYPPVKPVACPICGRRPKEIWDINPGGGFVKLRCKPWFRNAHLEVECGAADPEYAYQKAIKAWNEKVWEAVNGKYANGREKP